ncbi:hypothetical protein CVT25_005942 [Psilocybe cyanescens]|uniref:Uncharacterized protein n=1 Tax=Psilocybe cyanescens TaxID=93625 RepID=A0A409VSM6_PSICY|nr:hypothetical protein CVT25_005942 [Psilocybe cyanescens]
MYHGHDLAVGRYVQSSRHNAHPLSAIAVSEGPKELGYTGMRADKPEEEKECEEGKLECHGRELTETAVAFVACCPFNDCAVR